MNATPFDLQAELKNLPAKAGVYRMYDAEDTLIYIGKAKLLKNRVRSYFQTQANHSPKTRAMVAQIHHFNYIVTNTEVEALILEDSLIKPPPRRPPIPMDWANQRTLPPTLHHPNPQTPFR